MNKTPITPGPMANTTRRPAPSPAPYTPAWGRPVVHRVEVAPSTVTVSRNAFRAILATAITSTAVLLILLGMSSAQHRTAGVTAVTVSAVQPVLNHGHRGLNSNEAAILDTARDGTTSACWAEWNSISDEYEVLCNPGGPTGK